MQIVQSIKTMLLSNIKAEETLFKSLLFLFLILQACSSEEVTDATIFDACTDCTTSIARNVESNSFSHSITFYCPDNYGKFNTDVPPKVDGHIMYFLTDLNYILRYNLDQKDSILKPSEECQLPDIFPFIADYKILGDGSFLMTSRCDTNTIVHYNRERETLDTLMIGEGYVWSPMPFVGLTFSTVDDEQILPFVKVDDFNSGNFLGLFDASFNYKKGLGNSRKYDQKMYAPYYDTPIISQISKQTFFATYSSRNTVVKCNIKDDFEIEIESSYCFPDLNCACETMSIPQEKLGDFDFLSEKYTTSCYTLRLLSNNKFIYRMGKKCQPITDPITRKLNLTIDAPWVLDIMNIQFNEITRINFASRQYIYTSGFCYDDLIFLQKYSTDSQIITFHGY